MAKTVPFRLTLAHRGTERKFFSLFQGRDGSLYIHLYRPTGQPWRIPGRGPGDFEDSQRLDFTNYTEPGFALHKISFHRSGYIHLSDPQGRRFKDGTRGPDFEAMPSPYDLCALVPPRLDALPISDGAKAMTAQLILQDDVSPFYTTLSLVKGEVVNPGHPDTISPLLVLPLASGYSLAILTRLVRNRSPDVAVSWPPFPFFLLRTAA